MLRLGDDIIRYILNFCRETKSILNFMRTCKYYYTWRNVWVWDTTITIRKSNQTFDLGLLAKNVRDLVCEGPTDLNPFANLNSLSYKEYYIKFSIPDTLINLTHLDVSRCKISAIPCVLTNLIYLNINFTDVCYIPPCFTKLEELRCNSTTVKCIPNTLTNLKILKCIRTCVKYIPDSLVKLEKLECNCHRELPDTLVNLHKLNISYSNMLSIPHTFTKLVKLYCYGPSVREIPNTFVSLREIYCDRPKKIIINIQGVKIYKGYGKRRRQLFRVT